MRERATYLGIFAVAFATLMLEILLTRLSSVVGWYHMAFFVISLAMVGMTAGAVFVFLRAPKGDAAAIRRAMAGWTLAFAIAAPVAVAIVLRLPIKAMGTEGSFAMLCVYGAVLAIPFTAAGVALTLALTRSGLPAGRAYAADLVGAAVGCFAIVVVLNMVDAPSAVLVASAVASAAAALFAAGRLRIVALSLCVAGIGAAAHNASQRAPWLRPHWVKGSPDKIESFAFVGWNTYSRITLGKSRVRPPYLWAPAMGKWGPLERTLPQRTLLIDGAAATMMASLDTDPDDDKPGSVDDHAYLGWDVTSFAHLLRPEGAAAIIGVGGGRDVIEAVRAGHAPVVGVELNDLIVKLHTETFREYSGIADLPGVELVSDEARAYMARDTRRYDVITMSLIDTWASTGAGAYSLSENGLYTADGWEVFLRRLSKRGIFTVSRWYKPDSPGETARMVALGVESLLRLGVKDPKRHIFLLQSQQVATLMLSLTPYSEADIDRLQSEAVKRRFSMMMTPRKKPVHPMLAELMAQPNRAAMWQWASEQELDLTPPTDDRPFFFNMLKPSTWLKDPAALDKLDHSFLGNLQATQTLVYGIAVALGLVFVTIVLPLSIRVRGLRKHGAANLVAASAYFGLIGFGFMFVEMGLLSRLGVLLGHPTLALAVLLGGIILFAGLGSFASERIDPTRPRWALSYPLIPAALVLLSAAVSGPLLHASAAQGLVIRIAVSLVLLAPPAIGMGLAFPLGLRLVTRLDGDDRPPIGPWMWAINGASGVLASGAGLACSMVAGISTTLIVGALCYVALVPAVARLRRA